jgi:glyoxylase-like metal-dependent hydrolase (beta-lactamase superfamily II)
MQRALFSLALLVAPWSIGAAGAQEYHTTPLGEHALVWTRLYPDTGGRSNCTVLASSDGLIVVDPPGDPAQAQRLRQDVAEVLGPRPFRYVVNTHEHLGHLDGGATFPEAERIAHAGITEELIERNQGYAREQVSRLQEQLEAATEAEAARLRRVLEQDQAYLERFESFELTAPRFAFTDRLTLHCGDVTLRLIHFGKGHSDTDILVYVPEQGVLVVAGAVNPFLRIPGHPEAEWRRWIDVLTELTAPDAKVSHVVPAHWAHDLIGKEYLAFLRDYLRRLFDGVLDAQRDGMTLEQALEQLSLSSRPFLELPTLEDLQEADRYRALREVVQRLSGSPASPEAAMAEWIVSRHGENVKTAWKLARN